jgi:hypothetical protein
MIAGLGRPARPAPPEQSTGERRMLAGGLQPAADPPQQGLGRTAVRPRGGAEDDDQGRRAHRPQHRLRRLAFNGGW